MRVFVTGGAGFVGSNLVKSLIEDGHDVMIFDNLSAGKANNIHKDVLFYEGSILKDFDLGRAMVKFNPDVVYHLAAATSVRSNSCPSGTHSKLGFIGSINVIDASIEFGVNKMVFASSGGAVYGEARARLPVNECHPLNPISMYGVCKVAVENYLSCVESVHKFPSTVLRFSNMYGPNMRGETLVIPIFLDALQCGTSPAIFGDGSAVRDYLFIGDAVHAMLGALYDNGGVYNVGTGVGTSVSELFEMCQLLTERHDIFPGYSKRRPEEVQYNVLDCEKIKGALGWGYSVSFEDGLRMCFDARRID